MKLKKLLNPVGIVFIVFALIIGISLFLTKGHLGSGASAPASTGDPLQDDALYLVHLIETTHPAFLFGPPEGYEVVKNDFLSHAKGDLTMDQFKIMASVYLTSLHDGHTRIGLSNTPQLDIDWQYRSGALWLVDENKLKTDQKVTAIGGVPLATVFQTVDQLIPAENDSALLLNYEGYSKGRELLKYAGALVEDSVMIEVTDKEGQVQLLEVPLISTDEYSWQNYSVSTKKISEDTLLVTMGICEENQELEAAADFLKKGVQDGAKRVIIDVRNNPGGNSNACEKLLEAIGKRGGSYGCTIRYSPLANRQRGYSQSSGSDVYDNNPNTAINSDTELFVITNERTFSSATMLATWVKDGNLGKIVGQPSSNSPTAYGDVLNFNLPYTKFQVRLSHKQFTRPAGVTDNDRSLTPDYLLPSDEDPIAFILKLPVK